MPTLSPMFSPLTSPLPLAASLLAPSLIILACVVAGIGTILLLPGRHTVVWRRIGAAILAAAGLVFFASLFVAGEFGVNIYFWIFSAIALFGSVRVISHPKPVYSALYFVLTVFASAGLFVLLYAEFMAVALVIIYAGAILVTYTFVIMLAADAAPPSARPEDAAKEFLAEYDRRARAPWSAATVGFITMAMLLVVIFDRAPDDLEKRLSLIDPTFLRSGPTQSDISPLGTDAEGGADQGGQEFDVETNELRSAIEGEGTQFVVAQELDSEPGATLRSVPASRGLALRGDLYAYENQPSYAGERGGMQVLGIYLFTRQMIALQLAGLILTVAMVGAIVIARKQVISALRPAGLAREEEQGEAYTTPHTPVNDNPHSLPVHGTGNPRQKAYPQN